MKKLNFKILLPIAGLILLVTSFLALQGVLAGIGLGIAGMLIFGPNVEQIKGKTGGIIYGKNKSGSYSKVRIKPRNPNSNTQSANRQLHRELMQAWKRTDVNQIAYILYASSHPVQNKIGNTICLSGINWFVRINRMARKINSECGLILIPPKDDTVFPQMTGVTVSASASPQSVIVEPIKFGEYLEGMKIEIIATRQLSYGVFSPFGFRSIGVYDPLQLSVISSQSSVINQSSVISSQSSVDSNQFSVVSNQSTVDSQETNDEITTFPKFETLEKLNGIDITADYVAKFGQLTAGTKIFVKARLIMPTGEVTHLVGGSAVIH